MRTAELIFTGDELLRGDTVNTNQAYLGDRVLTLGLLPTRAESLLDDQAAITDRLRAALERRPALVLLSGGLGPTPDDLTREAVAEALGRPLEHHEDLYRQIAEVFERYGRPMVESNRKQASLPQGAHALDFIGTAPGFWLEAGETVVAALPGPPSELMHAWETGLEPVLRARLAGGGGQGSEAECAETAGTIVRRLLLYGLGESGLAEVLRDLPWRGGSVDVGTRAGYAGIDLILRVPDTPAGRQALADLEGRVRDRLGRKVYGSDGDTLASVLGGLLRGRGRTLVTAESCTGGLVGRLLTDRPGSSDYYLGGAIAYSNALKTALLGVPDELLREHGAVSEAAAAAMAAGARDRLGGDCAISVTGIAGPGGGTEEKPVGLVYVGTAVGPNVRVRRLQLWRSREDIRQRAAHTALDLLRLHLLDSAELESVAGGREAEI